jgi:hypothetical protein
MAADDRRTLSLEVILVAYELQMAADPDELSDRPLEESCRETVNKLRDISTRLVPPGHD